MPSPDSEALIDIIHNEWSVITHLASFEDDAHCNSEPAVISLILQTLNNI